VNIGKSASETLAQLTVAYGEYAMKKLFLNGIDGSRKGKMCKVTQQMGSQKRKRSDANMDRVRTLVRSD
jgi:hypothetical protein